MVRLRLEDLKRDVANDGHKRELDPAGLTTAMRANSMSKLVRDGEKKWLSCRSGDEKPPGIRNNKQILGTGRGTITWTRTVRGHQ